MRPGRSQAGKWGSAIHGRGGSHDVGLCWYRAKNEGLSYRSLPASAGPVTRPPAWRPRRTSRAPPGWLAARRRIP